MTEDSNESYFAKDWQIAIPLAIQETLPSGFILAVHKKFKELTSKYPSANNFKFAGEEITIISPNPNQERLDQYMKTESNYMERFVEVCKGKSVWVIGPASDGVPAILAAKKGASKVTCFEPDPDNFAGLLKNLRVNSVLDKIEVLPFAVWSEDGTVKLRTSGTGGDAPQVEANKKNKSTLERTKAGLIEVTARKINTLTKDMDFPDVLIIDVEGVEDSVLSSLIEVDKEKLPRDIFLEVHLRGSGSDTYKTGRILGSLGYSEIWSQPRGNELLVQLKRI